MVTLTFIIHYLPTSVTKNPVNLFDIIYSVSFYSVPSMISVTEIFIKINKIIFFTSWSSKQVEDSDYNTIRL